ncbi:MAG: SpoIID/LytB domain-containing protein [Armatimonadota bacterium]|nr:SpoIID/LytB domain-containing protein [Armatimonadota bacterium]
MFSGSRDAKTITRMLLTVLVLSVFSADRCACDGEPCVRIGLTSLGTAIKRATFYSVGGIKLFDAAGSLLLETESEDCVQVFAEGSAFVARSGLQVKSAPGPFVRLISRVSDAAVAIQLADSRSVRRYRGSVEARLVPAGMYLVNIVDTEDYLLGVVPAEMSSRCPLEAVKAQAVAARTYVLANLGKHRSANFDLCDTSHCQTYGGVSVETPRAAEAVRTTAHLILTYDGKPASVMYCSDCGGATQDVSQLRPNVRLPYLCGVREPEDIPHESWELSMALSDIAKKLVSAGLKQCENMSAIRVAQTDSSGRVLEFEITTNSGSVQVSGQKVRSAIGSSLMKSLLLSVEQTGSKVVFKGKGSGHGIGLCQAGAKWLASPPKNWTYDQILAHYFPGTQVRSLEEVYGWKARALSLVPLDQPKRLSSEAKEAKQTLSGSESASGRRNESNSRRDITFDVRVEAPNGL